MKKILGLGLLMILGLFVLVACGSDEPDAVDEPNEAGTVIEDPTEEEDIIELRIVAATVAATNVLGELNVDLVGIPTTENPIPEQFQGLPEVGIAHTPDLEVVASLEPDLFILDANFREANEAILEEFGINAFFFETHTFEAFLNSIRDLGVEIGRIEEATALIDSLENSIVEASVNRSDEGPRVAIIFGAGDSFMLESETSYLGDIASIMGAINIATELEGGLHAPRLPFSLEQILVADPDIVLRFAHGQIEQTRAMFDQMFDADPAFQTLTAVAEGRVYDLDPRVFGVSANLQVAQAFRELGIIFYGK